MDDKQTKLSSKDVEYLKTISKKLTVNILCDALKTYAATENVKVLEIKEGLNNFKRGESYLSSLFRLVIVGVVTASSGEFPIHVPVVVKAIPQNVSRKRTFRSNEFFETEINFYTKVWPKLLKFQEDKNTVIFNNIPRCLATVCDGDNDVIILEDISALNFVPLSRKHRVDLNHCLLVMRMFARFHAVSFAFKEQHPYEYENIVCDLKETYYADHLRDWHKNYFNNLTSVWMDAIEKEVPGSIYETKFKDLIQNDFYGQLVKCFKDEGKYAVISQGDAWQPNFMVQYNDNNPETVNILDFQLARNSSFVLDLLFFLFACVDNQIRKEHWNDLLAEYHQTLSKNLEKLGANPNFLTFADVENEFLIRGKYGLGMCLEAAPFSVMPDEETPDLETMEGEEIVDISTIWRLDKLVTKEHRMVLVDLVVEQVDRGFL